MTPESLTAEAAGIGPGSQIYYYPSETADLHIQRPFGTALSRLAIEGTWTIWRQGGYAVLRRYTGPEDSHPALLFLVRLNTASYAESQARVAEVLDELRMGDHFSLRFQQMQERARTLQRENETTYPGSQLTRHPDHWEATFDPMASVNAVFSDPVATTVYAAIRRQGIVDQHFDGAVIRFALWYYRNRPADAKAFRRGAEVFGLGYYGMWSYYERSASFGNRGHRMEGVCWPWWEDLFERVRDGRFIHVWGPTPFEAYFASVREQVRHDSNDMEAVQDYDEPRVRAYYEARWPACVAAADWWEAGEAFDDGLKPAPYQPDYT